MDRFMEAFLAYQKHVQITENTLMIAAIMKAIRGLPTEEEQIKILEAKMPIENLAAYLKRKKIDSSAILVELDKMNGKSEVVIQGPMLGLPRQRPAPLSVGNNPIGNLPVADDQGVAQESTPPETQVQTPPRKRIIMRPVQRQSPSPAPSGENQNAGVGDMADNRATDVDEPSVGGPQATQSKESKPGMLSKLGASLGNIWPKKEAGAPAAASVKQPRAQNRSSVGGKGLVLWLGIGVLVLLLVLVPVSASLMSSQNLSPDVADAPIDATQAQEDNNSAPVYVPDEAEMILELTEPMLKKPANFEGFINDFPLRWLLWVGFLLPLFSQLKQDRFAAAEKTDLISITIGILAMLALTVFSGALSVFASSYLVTTQMSSYPADFQASANSLIGTVIEALMVIMGVAFNLGMQLSASQSGKRDYSALAVGGFFSSGVILVWWYAGESFIVSLGWIMMFIGMYIQAKEMSKTYQGGGAIVVSFIMIAFFFLGFVISSFAMKYIVQMDLPEILAYAFYKSSLAVSVFIGALISWSGGDYIATNILPPTKLAGGADGEDSSASIVELPVTVKYDAMSFGMMIMYPLVSAWWYISALISTFS